MPLWCTASLGAKMTSAPSASARATASGTSAVMTKPTHAGLASSLSSGIGETEARPDRPGGDERRRYYGITPYGRRVAHAEARRMAELLETARRVDLAPGAGGA